MIDCKYCAYTCEEYKALAIHINTKHAHKHNKWAANFILKNVLFEQQKDEGRIPLTDEEKAAKRSTQRTLSGIEKNTNTTCPSCGHQSVTKLPVEYIQSGYAWRKNNELMINCLGCRRG
jgi:hypothetical protein